MAPRVSAKTLPARQETNIPIIEWETLRGLYNAFPPATSAENEVRDIIEFWVVGKVTAVFLQANAFSHSIVVDIPSADIDKIKAIARSAPRHNDANYRWPFNGTVAKFSTKDDLQESFQDVWDGRDIDDLSDIDRRLGLGIDDVEEGDQVMIEYTIAPYSGRKGKGTDVGFDPGCTLKLLSIGVLDKQRKGLNFESPRKRRRVARS